MNKFQYRVFYRDYVNEVSISSTEPEPLAADRLVPLAETLLVHEDNYLGILDGNDVLLQLYRTADGGIVLELSYPEANGCMQLRGSWQAAMELLAGLPREFTEDLLPNAHFIG